MAQNVTIAGADFPAVPALSIPLTGGGGNATFVDTSDADAVAGDIASGKTAYVNGTKLTGTASGGSATLITKNITANGTYNASSDNADGYSSVTVNVSGGGGSVEEKQVNFIDYDGTIVASYTGQEASALSALPSNPSHTGLTAQGWNWTLQQIKTYLTSYPKGKVWVGQMYTTSDGKTHIKINADAGRVFYIRFTQTTANGVEVDWGDGSAVETYSGTSADNHPHTYAQSGEHEITLNVKSGTVSFVGSSSQAIFGATSNYYNRGKIISVSIGKNVTDIGNYAFYYCYALALITIPSTLTTISQRAFYYCYALRSITIPSEVVNTSNYMFTYCVALDTISIPSGVTSIGSNCFQYCYVLRSITIPSGITSIYGNSFDGCYTLQSVTIPTGVISLSSSCFQNCYALRSITIPSDVTSIGGSSFSGCYNVNEYHFKPTTPPTLSNTNAFGGLMSGTVIYVPRSENQSVLNAYKTANNWSTYASYMQEEPQ